MTSISSILAPAIARQSQGSSPLQPIKEGVGSPRIPSDTVTISSEATEAQAAKNAGSRHPVRQAMIERMYKSIEGDPESANDSLHKMATGSYFAPIEMPKEFFGKVQGKTTFPIQFGTFLDGTPATPENSKRILERLEGYAENMRKTITDGFKRGLSLEDIYNRVVAQEDQIPANDQIIMGWYGTSAG